MIKKRLLKILIVIMVLVVIGFMIPKETKPSSDTRIILEHTYKTYIAPGCFEQSNPTNFLQDSTLGEAQNLNYDAHDSCTIDRLKNEKDSLIISLLKDVGVLDKKWDNW
ncbi:MULTISPECIES: hypothetical protein [Oceanobacillus]|uniref:hypothetical protein n=1 Tax=Oceanobacillus TaxID=182709 RepID=UPI000595DBB8|nr:MULTISPECIES: hypothetical protein [Oceanobacillus]